MKDSQLRIGPCRDPLCLWFLEWRDDRGRWRRYFADRGEARAALKVQRQLVAISAIDPHAQRHTKRSTRGTTSSSSRKNS